MLLYVSYEWIIMCSEIPKPIKFTWRLGRPAPKKMANSRGYAVVDGETGTAYFSQGFNVYVYRVTNNKWTELPQCINELFAIAVVNNLLTTIGGRNGPTRWFTELITNKINSKSLLSLGYDGWKEALPPKPTG